MSNRPSRLNVSMPIASPDGRFYGRYPNGDKPVSGAALAADALGQASANAGLTAAIRLAAIASGRAASTAALSTAIRLGASAHDVASATGQMNASALLDADFQARVLACNADYALNFDDVWIDGVLQPGRKINNKQDMLDEALDYQQGSFNGRPVGEKAEDHLEWDTTRKLSGRASMKVITMPGDGAAGGGMRFNPSGISGAAPRTRFFSQFSVYYAKETLGYRWRLSGDQSNSGSGLKVCNFGQAGGAQVVLYNPRFLGFPSAFLNQSSGNIAENTGDTLGSNPWGLTAWHIHNTIDTGRALVTKADWLERYGPLPRAMDGDMDLSYDPGTYLYQRTHARGWPDSSASINGFPFVLDGWTTFEVMLEYNAADPAHSTVMIWAAQYGLPPKLIYQGIGNVPLFNNPDNAWDSVEFLNYDTQRISEIGVRPTLFTNYAEPIFAQRAIPFPGGWALPHHLGGPPPAWLPATVAAGWPVGTWIPISGPGALPFGLGSTNRMRDVKTVQQSDPDFQDSLTAWSGAPGYARDMGAYGTYLAGQGGAHSLGGSGYEGNEIFGLDLGSRAWSQVRAAYANYLTEDPNPTFGDYPDGSPTPAHIDGWIATSGRLPGFPKGLVVRPKSLQNVNDSTLTVALPYSFALDLNDPTGRGWTRGDPIPQASSRTGWKDHIAGLWDERRRKYWLWSIQDSQDANHLATFDPLALPGAQWIDYRPANPNGGHGWSGNGIEQCVFHDRKFDRLITLDFRNTDTVRYLNPNLPQSFNTNGATAWTIAELGSPPVKTEGIGLGWSNWRQAAITWSGAGSAQVHQFKYTSGAPGTQGVAGNLVYTWSSLLNGANANTPALQGVNDAKVYNRFQVITYAGYEIAIAVTLVDGPVYAFLLAVPTTPKG